MATAYCMKCNKKVEIKYPVPVTVKGVHGINGFALFVALEYSDQQELKCGSISYLF